MQLITQTARLVEQLDRRKSHGGMRMAHGDDGLRLELSQIRLEGLKHGRIRELERVHGLELRDPHADESHLMRGEQSVWQLRVTISLAIRRIQGTPRSLT